MKTYKNKKGFTLIELLVVISIIGLLSAIVMTSLSSARAKGRDAKRIRDIEEIHTAIELYISDNNSAPDILNLTTDKTVEWNTLATYLVPTYLKKLPTDPCGTIITASCTTSYPSAKGNVYAYEYEGPTFLVDHIAGFVGNNTSYMIYAENLEAKKNKYFGFNVESF